MPFKDISTPLFLAVHHENNDYIKILLEYVPDRVNINYREPTYGLTALYMGATVDNSEGVQLLCANKYTDINLGSTSNATPFFQAATKGNLASMEELLKYYPERCDINILNSQKWSTFQTAIYHNKIKAVRRLLKIPDLDLNQKTPDGYTPLGIAVMKGLTGMVKELIKYSPRLDINLVGKEGNTALFIACIGKHPEIAKLLCAVPNIDFNTITNTEFRVPPFYYAARCCFIDVVKEFLPYIEKINVNFIDEDNNTALHNTIIKEDIDMVRLLCSISKMDLSYQNKKGTYLHFACETGIIEIVNELLKYKDKYNINAVDKDGNTALHIACKRKYVKIVKRLLDIDVDRTIRNKKGKLAEECI